MGRVPGKGQRYFEANNRSFLASGDDDDENDRSAHTESGAAGGRTERLLSGPQEDTQRLVGF